MEQCGKNDIERLNCLVSEIDAAYHEIAARLGLSDSAMMILYILYSSGGDCLIREITRRGISKQTVSSSLRRLEDANIVRLESAGGRKKRIRLTAEGERFSDATVRKVIRIENTIFAEWQAEEREAYIALTRKFLISLKARTAEL